MAVTLGHAAAAMALLAVAAVCADGASTFYSSDPNLGSARVVFQVTATFHPPGPSDRARLLLRDSPAMSGPEFAQKGRFLVVSWGGIGLESLELSLLVEGLGNRGLGRIWARIAGDVVLAMQIRSQNWLGA